MPRPFGRERENECAIALLEPALVVEGWEAERRFLTGRAESDIAVDEGGVARLRQNRGKAGCRARHEPRAGGNEQRADAICRLRSQEGGEVRRHEGDAIG